MPASSGSACGQGGRSDGPAAWQVGLDPVEEQRRLVDEVLQRSGVLDDRRLGHLVEPEPLVRGQVPPGVDDDPEVLRVDVALDRLQQLEAAHVGQVQVEHHAVERLALQRLEGLGRGADGRDPDVAVAERGDDAGPLDLVVLDDQQLPDPAIEEALDAGEGVVERLLAHRLLEEGERPEPDARAASCRRPR